MQQNKAVVGLLLASLIGMTPCLATAGPFADDMAKCLVRSTSEADRTELMRWMFAAMSQHPGIASLSSVSDKMRNELNVKTGQLFTRLLATDCKSETTLALKNEGPQTIGSAFEVLGQVAARGLFADPHVVDAMQAVAKAIDESKLKELTASTAAK